jgi:hypothetical protein
LDFFLGSPERRRESLRKIDMLIDTLTSFRHALPTEAELIKNHRR